MNLEKETTINYTKYDKYAYIYTNQIRDINRLNKMCLSYPEFYKKEKEHYYLIDKKLINFRKPRILSVKTKKNLIFNIKKISK